jgi:hypothetical protein
VAATGFAGIAPVRPLRKTPAVVRGENKPPTCEHSRKLYRSRGAVEREFGRPKHEWALLPLRVRGLDRVRLYADLTILTKLASALARGRAVPLAA